VNTDGDNDGYDGTISGRNAATGNDKAWITGGVCWNDDGETVDSDCKASSDYLIAAGEWAANTAVQSDDSGGEHGVMLISDGNNDDGVTDWVGIPEFSTLLMPIASVLMIVGYSYYRRKDLPEA